MTTSASNSKQHHGSPTTKNTSSKTVIEGILLTHEAKRWAA
jgi:hypothetical protein